MRAKSCRCRRDKRGAVAVVFAAGAVCMLCVAGVVIDGGDVYTAKRSLQGATDLAAISAASDLPHATSAADATAADNGYAASDVEAVTPGVYTPDPNIPPSQRFQASSLAAANAVQVTMTHQQPLFFAPVFRLQEGGTGNVPNYAPLVTQAIANVQRTASFAIGSRVASFNGGIVNAILGATVGGQVSLSLIDYNALASGQVDLFAFAKAISIEVGKVGETYGQAAAQTVTMAQFLAALEQAAPTLAPELQILANAASAGVTVDLSRLINFGQYSNMSTLEAEPQITATASALQLLQAAAQVGGAPHLINLNIAANIPGIAAVTGMMTIGEPAQYSSVMAVAPGGTSVHTAQIRLYLDVSLASAVDGGVVHLPLYLEVGYGTASLGGLSCNALNPASTQVTLNVTPGLINGWIGNVTAEDMVNYNQEPIPTAATLLTLANIATVTGRVNATVGDITPVAVNFNATDIQNDTIQTSDTTDFLGALIASLVGNLQMQVNVLGLQVIVPPGLTSSVAAALTPAVAPVDQLITGVLQTVGVGVGEADTWVTGAHCSAATLSG
ncbi:MAG TPA: TadG family pilus assembly protein [Acetobacteraceae bacterium]|nr:TadG family pilus assembly protein [Acetobacteraceae bacterium]